MTYDELKAIHRDYLEWETRYKNLQTSNTYELTQDQMIELDLSIKIAMAMSNKASQKYEWALDEYTNSLNKKEITNENETIIAM